MEKLQKQLQNKESQFREMSAQLVMHLNKINNLTEEIETLKSKNSNLHIQISQKDEILSKLLTEKSELFEILQALESPKEPSTSILPTEPKQEIQVLPAEEKQEQIKENPLEDEKEEEIIKEESYISNEIDITAELEKLGIVDLVKKY